MEHNKLHKSYKNMEQTVLKQQKELEDLKMEIGNVYQAKSEIQRQVYQRHAQMDQKLQKQMAFNEKLHKLLEEMERIKPFNYDSVFIDNNEYKKHNTLLQIRLKALSTEDKDVDIWWDAIHDLVQKDIRNICRGMREVKGCTCIGYLRWKRSCQDLNMNLWFSFQNSEPHMKKKTKGILMVQYH